MAKQNHQNRRFRPGQQSRRQSETIGRVKLQLGEQVCAHAGMGNILDYVQHRIAGKPIRALIGGLHLGTTSDERIDRAIARLRDLELE